MATRIIAILLVACSISGVARADDVAPGLWEIILAAKVDAEPGFDPGPLTTNQCLTKKDAQDPSRILGSLATAGASDCTYSKAAYAGNTLHFAMQCSGTLSLKTTGDITFSSTKMSGALTTSSSIDGKSVVFKSALTARRLGDC